MAVLKDLIVHGASYFINLAQFKSLFSENIAADKGIFNKLIATSAGVGNIDFDALVNEQLTVVGLLDVKGELHTSTWTNSNISTIDGSFYITPTLGLSESGTPVAAVTTTSITFSGPTYSLDSIYLKGNESNNNVSTSVSWTTGAKVLVTGEVKVGETWMPLGTLTGTLGTITSTSVQINNLRANKPATDSTVPTTINAIIDAKAAAQITNNTPYRNVKISMYQTNKSNNGTTFYPLGIYMTANGANGRTFIDLYGGDNAVSSTYTSAMALPVVRIGNLTGVNLPTVGGIKPNGWGIYTNNGFFDGVVAAKKGYIGSDATYKITISANSTNAAIYSGSKSTFASTENGFYLGADGIAIGAYSSPNTVSPFQVTNTGVLTARGATIEGALTASSLATGTKTGSTSGNGTFIDGSGNIYAGNGSTNKFTVTSAGVLTATDANVLTATIGNGTNKITLGKSSANSSYSAIYSGSHSSLASTVDGFYLGTDGLSIGANFSATVGGTLTAVGANLKGLTIYDASGNKRAGIDSTEGFLIYDGATPTTDNVIAQFGSTVKIGQTTGENINFITIDSDGLRIYKDQSDIAAAEFSSMVRIGNEWQVEIGGDSINIIDNTENEAATVTTFNGEGITFFDGLGTAERNIIGEFGTNGAIIGAEGSTTRAKFTADAFEIEDNNLLNILKIGKGEQLENTYDTYYTIGSGSIKNSTYVDYSLFPLDSTFSRTLQSPVTTIVVTIPWIRYTSATSSTSGTITFNFDPYTTETQTNGPLTATYNSTTSLITIQATGATNTYTDCVIRDYVRAADGTIPTAYSSGLSFNGKFVISKQTSLNAYYVIKFSGNSTKTYNFNHTFSYNTLNNLGIGKTLSTTQTYNSEYTFGMQLRRSSTNNFQILFKCSRSSGSYGRPLLSNTSYITYPVTGVLIKMSNARITYNGVADAPYYNLGHREEYSTMGAYSLTLGENLEAPYPRSMVIGRYNDASEDYMFTVANGTNANGLNLFTIDPTGNVQLNGTITLANNKGIRGTTTTGDTRSLCYVSASDNDVFGGGSYGTETGTVYFEGNTVRIRSKGGTGITLDSDHNYFRPTTANATALGTTTYYWTRCYCNTSMWTASDKKLKDSIDNIDFAQDLIMNLKPVQFKLKANDHRRTHMGFIAQEANETAKKLNKNLSFIIADYKDNNKGTYLGEDADDNELSWGLAYEELIAPMVQVIQNQQKEINILKEEVKKLKNK